MSKYNEKDKREIINLIEKENYSIRAAAKKLGISKSVVKSTFSFIPIKTVA